MDQQAHHEEQIKTPFVNRLQEGIEEGEVVQIRQKIQKVKVTKNSRCQIDGSDSQWSWDSIEDLKGVDLKNLQVQEEGNERIQPEQKEKQKIKVIYPQKPTNIQNLPIKYVGCAKQLVGDLLIVQADLKQTYQVVDLDGWVCDNNKSFIGFVIDVFGKIQSPFYAIKFEQHLQNLQTYIGKSIFYIQGTKILNEDEIKSIQSKNNKQFQIQESSSSHQDIQQQQMSVQGNQFYKEHKKKNIVDNRRNRKSSFDHADRNQERSRTRENFKNKNFNIRQNNQQYLQQMYAVHYNQMMQFYNPNYRPNTSIIPTIPPPPVGNPAQFVLSNQSSYGSPPFQYGSTSSSYVNSVPTNSGSQPPRVNSFIHPQNYQNNNTRK